MNITLYSHYFAPEIGAPSARLYDLSQNWLKQGRNVQAVTCFPNHPGGKLYDGYGKEWYQNEDYDGINVHRHWTYITPNEGVIKKTLGHISYLPGVMFLSNRRVQKPDVTVGSSPTLFAAEAAARSAKRFKVPFVMEVRDLWPAIFVELGILKNKQLIRMLEYWEMSLYRRASKIVTVTEAFRQNLIERGIDEEKVVNIPNGADVDYWQPNDQAANIKNKYEMNGKFIVLYIGAHGISHALGKIVDAAHNLRDNENIEFLFVGDGAEKKKLIQKAKEMNVKNIRFLDPVDKKEVRKFYELADVCLVPLRNIPLFDTFIPSKMFEIMSMQRPIVGSVRGEPADILNRSGGAIVVEPENSDQIAWAILELYNNPSKRETMGQQGRAFVAEHYSREKLANEYLEVFKKVTSLPQKPRTKHRAGT